MRKEKLNCLYRQDTRLPIDRFSREDAVRNKPTAYCISVYGSKEHWAAFNDSYVLTCLGPRMFWKKTITVNTTYKEGKLYGLLTPFIRVLCEVFNFDWILTNKWTFNVLLERKDLWKAVFSNKITNPEMLCKTVSKKYFKGAYSYKTLREAAKNYRGRNSLWDLYYYTTNPEETLKLLMNPDLFDNLHTIEDTIEYCKILNTKFNPLWSIRRIQEEHQKQIELCNSKKIESFSDTPITAPYSSDGLSLILDERACFVEGFKMHNCVHSCYWRQIESGQYLIAKGTVNGEYIDLGMAVTPENIVFNQAHTTYNGSISASVKRFCEEWIRLRQNELRQIAIEIKSNKYLDVQEGLPW